MTLTEPQNKRDVHLLQFKRGIWPTISYFSIPYMNTFTQIKVSTIQQCSQLAEYDRNYSAKNVSNFRQCQPPAEHFNFYFVYFSQNHFVLLILEFCNWSAFVLIDKNFTLFTCGAFPQWTCFLSSFIFLGRKTGRNKPAVGFHLPLLRCFFSVRVFTRLLFLSFHIASRLHVHLKATIFPLGTSRKSRLTCLCVPLCPESDVTPSVCIEGMGSNGMLDKGRGLTSVCCHYFTATFVS